MADGDINVDRRDPISPRDHGLQAEEVRGNRDLLEAQANAVETAFEFADASLEGKVGDPVSLRVNVLTDFGLSGGPGPVKNTARSGDDDTFGVTVTITSGSGKFITPDGLADSVLLTGFKSGEAVATVVSTEEETLSLALSDTEGTGLTVTDTLDIDMTIAGPEQA